MAHLLFKNIKTNVKYLNYDPAWFPASRQTGGYAGLVNDIRQHAVWCKFNLNNVFVVNALYKPFRCQLA